MNRFIHGVTRAVAETFDLPGPILELGSYQVAGQEAIAELRDLFAGKAYLGVDARPGKGVDQVADVEQLPFADRSIGTVIALNTFEHVRRFWRGFDEIHRVLRPDGALLVSCPFYFHIHSYPSDYWRFTPEAWDVLLEGYASKIIGWHGPRKRPANVWALAFRGSGVSATDFARYRNLLRMYTRQPLAWSRRLRYRVAGLICGRRPFAPYLDQNRWETECRPSKPA